MKLKSASEDPVVRARNLCKRFGATQALEGVGIEVRPGEMRALVGRNGAGKSTLVSLLTGLLAPDTGTIEFAGLPAPAISEPDSWQTHVACVHQHSKVLPNLSCAENLYLNRNVRDRALISWRRMRREARAIFEHWGLHQDVDSPASNLGVGERQVLEIARALLQGARFLILDEPTAKLQSAEVDRLFSHLRALQRQGVGIIYISHYLDEIFDLCQSVTVLRDGRVRLDAPLEPLRREELIDAMVGAEYPGSAPTNAVRSAPISTRSESTAQPPRLSLENLTSHSHFSGLSFTVRAGECLGIGGIAGSGKEGLADVLAGLKRCDSGTLRIDDTVLPSGDVADHIRAGIGFVPPDRHAQGLVLGLSVAENAAMCVADQLGPFGFVRPHRLSEFARTQIRAIDIKTADPSESVANLSGGNQQKVVLARALARGPKVLVLCHPTSGVDIASKATLFGCIRDAARSGTAVLIISDELEELERCDRVLILRSGQSVFECVPPFDARALVAQMEGVSV